MQLYYCNVFQQVLTPCRVCYSSLSKRATLFQVKGRRIPPVCLDDWNPVFKNVPWKLRIHYISRSFSGIHQPSLQELLHALSITTTCKGQYHIHIFHVADYPPVWTVPPIPALTADCITLNAYLYISVGYQLSSRLSTKTSNDGAFPLYYSRLSLYFSLLIYKEHRKLFHIFSIIVHAFKYQYLSVPINVLGNSATFRVCTWFFFCSLSFCGIFI